MACDSAGGVAWLALIRAVAPRPRRGRRGKIFQPKPQVGDVLADLVSPGQTVRVAQGGRGGRGNLHFRSSTNRAPSHAEEGRSGDAYWLRLELKLLADVGLVGFPNVGKSTLMNILSKSEVFAEDKLFATLDTTVRKVVLERTPFLLSDTVGFISDLPTELVASFRATLEEVLAADLIVHVRDISHEGTEEQATDVRAILTSLGGGENAKQIEVWNKIDLLDADDHDAVLARAARHDDVIAVSSLTGYGMQDFVAAVEEALEGEIIAQTIVLPYSEGRKRAWLFERSLVEAERQGEDGFELDLRWKAKDRAQFDTL